MQNALKCATPSTCATPRPYCFWLCLWFCVSQPSSLALRLGLYLFSWSILCLDMRLGLYLFSWSILCLDLALALALCMTLVMAKKPHFSASVAEAEANTFIICMLCPTLSPILLFFFLPSLHHPSPVAWGTLSPKREQEQLAATA